MPLRSRWLLPRALALVAGAAAALLPVLAAAQDPSPAPGFGVGTGVSGYGLGDWLSLGGRLALVLLVIWGAVMAMRWYVRRMNGETGGSVRRLQVLETRALGPNRSLALVRLGGRAVLLGVTQERISQLLTIDDPNEVERIAAPPETDAAGSARTILSGLNSLRSMQASRAAELAQRRAEARATKAPASTSAPSMLPMPPMLSGAGGLGPALTLPLRAMLAVPRAFARVVRDIATRRPSTARGPSTPPVVPGGPIRAGDAAASAAAGLQARTRYQQQEGRSAERTLPPLPDAPRVAPVARRRPAARGFSVPAADAGTSFDREQRIAELQRAIAEARRTAG